MIGHAGISYTNIVLTLRIKTTAIGGKYIRIQGLPEAMDADDLSEIVKGIFLSLYWGQQSRSIWNFIGFIGLVSHKILIQPNKDMLNTCVKEDIKRKAIVNGPINFKGTTVHLLQDLCRFTMEKRKALKPLLALLQDCNIPYHCNFPFQLQIRKDGKWLIIHGPSDIPAVLTALELTELLPLKWPQSYYLFWGKKHGVPVSGKHPGRSGIAPSID